MYIYIYIYIYVYKFVFIYIYVYILYLYMYIYISINSFQSCFSLSVSLHTIFAPTDTYTRTKKRTHSQIHTHS